MDPWVFVCGHLVDSLIFNDHWPARSHLPLVKNHLLRFCHIRLGQEGKNILVGAQQLFGISNNIMKQYFPQLYLQFVSEQV